VPVEKFKKGDSNFFRSFRALGYLKFFIHRALPCAIAIALSGLSLSQKNQEWSITNFEIKRLFRQHVKTKRNVWGIPNLK